MQQDRSTSDQRQHNLALSLQTQSQRRTDTQAMGSTHCMGLKPLPRGQEEKEGAQFHGSTETKMHCSASGTFVSEETRGRKTAESSCR